MSRGRPAENSERPSKRVYTYYEVPSKPELGCVSKWYYDDDKTKNGPWKVEDTYPKGSKPPKPKIQKNQTYSNMPVVMVFKTSNRSNAKTKMKVWKNTNIDYILTADKLPGVPDKAIVLELGVGESFIKSWQSKYNL
jgi:hypothetical protein